jgi:hypothetical protein
VNGIFLHRQMAENPPLHPHTILYMTPEIDGTPNIHIFENWKMQGSRYTT